MIIATIAVNSKLLHLYQQLFMPSTSTLCQWLFPSSLDAFPFLCLYPASPGGIKTSSSSPSPIPTSNHDAWTLEILSPRSPTVFQPDQPFAYPSYLLLLSGVVALSMAFYNTLLRIAGHNWSAWNAARTSPIIYAHVAPEPAPPHRRTRTPSSPFNRRTKQLLLTAFALLSQTAVSTPVISLKSERFDKDALRKHRGFLGLLATPTLTDSTLCAIQHTMRIDSSGFHALMSDHQNVIQAVMDTGASHSCSPSAADFLPGSLQPLDRPIKIGGIAGDLPVTHAGTLQWETLGDDGSVVKFQTKGLLVPALPTRLFSPQSYLREDQRLEDHFRVFHNRTEWHERERKLCTVHHCPRTFLPKIVLFRSGSTVKTLEAMAGCVTSETNQNLTPAKKHWIRWHFKLGHLGFKMVRELGLGGFLDTAAFTLFRIIGSDAKVPKCAACQFGQQTLRPDGTTHVTKVREGGLKKDILQPGQLTFMDHIESTNRGRLFHTAGRELDANKFRGSTLFVDAATNRLHAEHQVTLSANETISSKTRYERLAQTYGVDVQAYHTDNGVFKSQAFLKAVTDQKQTIRFSGVSAKWQNGAAEGAVRIVVSRARTMMIHAALHWPEIHDEELWPMAVDYAIHLYNNTPQPHSGLSPNEIFSGTKSDHQALKNAHTWGCPVYVLDPKIADGHKLPKWRPRARRAQFMGVSPIHAETVHVVRNLNTGFLSPQCHVVFDDWFETTYSDEDTPPSVWAEMQIYQRYKVELDHDDIIPSLRDEWLTSDELHERHNLPPSRVEPRDGRITSQEANPVMPTNRDRTSTTLVLPESQKPWPFTTIPQSTEPAEHPSIPRETSDASPTPSVPREAPLPPPLPREPSPARRSSRHIKQKQMYVPEDGTTTHVHIPGRSRPTMSFARAISMLLVASTSTPHCHIHYANSLGTDPDTEHVDSIYPGIMQDPSAVLSFAHKAKAYNPDLPSVREALTGPNSEEFWTAMDKEIASLEEMETWKIVPRGQLAHNASVIPGTWAMRIKRKPDGSLSKFKARFCVRGDMMQQGLHFSDSSYSPVVGWPTIRSTLVMAASLGLHTRQVDFINAFCQASQKEPLFIELPQYYKVKGREQEDLVLCLEKSLYGQVNAPKLFFEHISEGLNKVGFTPSESDPCLFINHEDDIMVLQYVDDQIWIAKDPSKIEKRVQELTELGHLLTIEEDTNMFGFLGIDISREGDQVELTQKGLTDKVIRYLDMDKSVSKELTPAAANPLGTDKDGQNFDEDWSYPAAIGMLLYLSSNTRPDIQFAVHQAARFSHAPKQSHARAVKRIVRYLAATTNDGTLSRGIRFKPDLTSGLDMYVDADYAGLFGCEDDQDPTSVKSRTGFVLTLFNCPVLWSSKLQTDICLSSTAAEYVAFSMGMRELLPMRELVKEVANVLGLHDIKDSLVRSTVFEDNQGCLSLVNVPRMSPRNKYLALKYHFFRNHIGEKKGIIAKYIRSAEQKADIFTKGLTGEAFSHIRLLLMGW